MIYNIDSFLRSKYCIGISEEHTLKLKELFTTQIVITSNNIKPIIEFIQNDVEGSWKQRYERLQTEYKRDGISIESLQCRYGNIIGEKIFNNRKLKYTPNKEKYELKHGKNSWNDLGKRKAAVGLQLCIQRHGEHAGTIKWKNYLKKWKKSIKEKSKSGTWKENSTLNSYINKYGTDIGYALWNKRIFKWKYSNSKSGYIKKYGRMDGSIKWKESCNKKSITMNKMIVLYGKKEGEKRFKIWKTSIVKNNRTGKTYSKISQVLFWDIYNSLPVDKKRYVKFAELNEEETFYLNACKIAVKADFKFNNKIIEFDGYYWHNLPGVKYKDSKKQKALEALGYIFLRIPEKAYIKNKNAILKKCINFIKE